MNHSVALFLVAIGLHACTENPFPHRKVVELSPDETLEVLDQSVEGNYLVVQYVSEVSLRDPLAVARRAQEILLQYAGPEAERVSLEKVELRATEWLDGGQWAAQTFVCERNSEGSWDVLHY